MRTKYFRLNPFFVDIFLTFLAQVVMLGCSLLLFRLAAKTFGPDGFGAYTLARRIIAFAQPVVLLGFGVGLVRHVGCVVNRDLAKQASYVAAASLYIITFTILVAIVMNFFCAPFSRIFFGSSEYSTLILPITVMLFGLSVYSIAYSYYRGCILMKVANLLQIIGMGILPILVLWVIPDCTIRLLLIWTGIALCVTSFVFGLPIMREVLRQRGSLSIHSSSKELLRYGLPRVPGSFASYGLLALGPIIAAHFVSTGKVSMKEVGYLSVSISFILLISSSITPLGLILLPKLTSLLAQDETTTIIDNLTYLATAVLHISIFATVQLIIFIDLIITCWLGSEFLEAALLMRIVMLSIPFYLLYGTLASPIDAAHVKAINAKNIYISLVVFLLTALATLLIQQLMSPIVGLSVALSASFGVLGILSCLSAKKIYNLSFELYSVPLVIFINLILGITTFAIKPFMRFGLIGLFQLAVLEIAVFAIFLLVLRASNVKWPEKMIEKAVGRI